MTGSRLKHVVLWNSRDVQLTYRHVAGVGEAVSGGSPGLALLLLIQALAQVSTQGDGRRPGQHPLNVPLVESVQHCRVVEERVVFGDVVKGLKDCWCVADKLVGLCLLGQVWRSFVDRIIVDTDRLCREEESL